VQIVNAFTANGQGGNPAGVVLNADKLTHHDKQKIAASVGLSETAFVSKSDIAAFKLDFFTPNRQIAHCGHATIATFAQLADFGKVRPGVTSKETIDGTRKIIIHNDEAFMEQLAPRYSQQNSWAYDITDQEIWSSLGLTQADLDGVLPPVLVNTGNSFLIQQVDSVEALEKLRPDFDQITRISEVMDLIGYYVFTTETPHGDATARMFAPRYGIEEEAATGMAAGPLGCVLYDYLGLDKTEFLIEQGRYMSTPSPSHLKVKLTVTGDGIESLMVGGRAKISKEITVTL